LILQGNKIRGLDMERSDAEILAKGYLERSHITMSLEGQEISEEERKKMLEKWIKILMEDDVG
jgi:hypothetical protein